MSTQLSLDDIGIDPYHTHVVAIYGDTSVDAIDVLGTFACLDTARLDPHYWQHVIKREFGETPTEASIDRLHYFDGNYTEFRVVECSDWECYKDNCMELKE